MSTINRFNKFSPRDYSMEWYAPEVFTPNFEGWDNLLGTHQARYDAAMAATQKYPKHLENRMDLAGQYRQNAETAVNDITQSYMKEGINAGNRKMRDFGLQLNKDWQPGGLAYELEQEFNDYQTAAQTIDKYYKDNKAENSANRLYSLDKLKQASQGEFKQDKTTGMYQRANITPSLHPYVDIAEEAQKLVKDIKENGTSDIVKMSPAWFQKIQTEEVTSETIRQVTDALLQQPKYSEQRAIELWREKSQYTPEQIAQIEANTKQQYLDNFNKQVGQLDSLKKDKKNVTSLQETLQSEGYYSGKINGSFDKDTKEAYEKYKNDSKAKLEETINNTNIDTILNKKMLDNYTKPLVAAYTRKKVEKELIFNKEWEVQMKLAGQREQTSSLVTAIQSLKAVPQSEFLNTPGLARPMDTLDQLKSTSQKTYNDSKKSFNDIANLSGITNILGTSAPNQIHAATEARLKSATPEEFAENLKNAGVSGDPQKLWDYFNSPGAGNLKNSYVSMQQAKEDMEGTSKAEIDIINNFFKTSEGKKELGQLQKQYPFLKNESQEKVAQMISNNDSRLSFETPQLVTSGGVGNVSLNSLKKTNIAKSIKDRINESKDPELFPESLRGYAFTAINGSGGDMKKAVIEDFVSGYTLGYTTDGNQGAQFKTIEQNGKGKPVELSNVDLANSDLRFNVDAKGVSYYITAKELGKDGKPVVMVAEAPKEHYGRLKQVSLEMLRQAEQTKNKDDRDKALQMYAVVTDGPQINNAVQDQIVLTNKNSRKLYDVIDPIMSKKTNGVVTFVNNEFLDGMPIGTEIKENGLIYQKFKVRNPKTQTSSYMMTYKTNGGYMPILNNSGGLYYKDATEANSPVLMGKMMREIPVEVNNQKINSPNISEEEAASLLLNVWKITNNDN